jgi:hypothetical protein
MKKKQPSLEFILRLALKDELPILIEGQHPQYKGVDKIEMLRLCSILKNAGYLEIDLEYGEDGRPIPGYSDYMNVTVKGRDYLSRIEQGKLWRRAIGWGISFTIGILTPLIIEFFKILLKIFAKMNGVEQ